MGGFRVLEHEGEVLEVDDEWGVVDDGVYEMNYQHIARTTFMDDESRHSCLYYGEWCWENLREHPLDIIDYIKAKLIRRRLYK